MDTGVVVKVTAEGKLQLPPEISAKLHPGDEYIVSVTDYAISLTKVQKPLELNDWFRRLEEAEPDPNQPTLQEISEIVKEVRREGWSQT